MPRGIYKRTDVQKKMLAEMVAKVRVPLDKYYFKKGFTPWNKGKSGIQVPWNKGKKGVQDFSKISGKNHYNWKGGITRERVKIWWSKEYKLWRKSVFERDNYTCVWCGARNGNGKAIFLEADHIKPFAEFPELRFTLENGRTLCKDCHKKTDTYGVKKKRQHNVLVNFTF